MFRVQVVCRCDRRVASFFTVVVRRDAGAAAVLLVDDEELARLRLRSLVGECTEPRTVIAGEAANAAQALVWLETRRCDVVLLDVQMPGRDGTQLAAELRQRSPAPAIVFRHRARPSTR